MAPSIKDLLEQISKNPLIDESMRERARYLVDPAYRAVKDAFAGSFTHWPR